MISSTKKNILNDIEMTSFTYWSFVHCYSAPVAANSQSDSKTAVQKTQAVKKVISRGKC